MSDEIKRISGFTIVLDKTPPKWTGSIYLKSEYKQLAEYVTSTKESFSEALSQIIQEYKHKEIKGISLQRVDQ